MRSGFLIAFSLVLAVPLAASAQAIGNMANIGPSFTFEVSPQYPAPHSTAVLSFTSSSLDLSNATLTVSVGGKNIYTGTVQPVSVVLGKTGSVTNVRATLSAGGSNYTQSLSIQPEDVTLIAEPVSSVPPLYRGKSEVPLEGDVRVVAIANLKNASGTTLNSSTLSYAWTVDGTQVSNSSGIGKTTLMVAAPLQYRERSVTVTVQSQDGSLVGGASLSLSPQDPIVRIYENDPLLGIRFDRALQGEHTIAAESTLYAAPFSFPTTIGAPQFQWFLNGEAAQTGNSITLRPTGSGQGNAALSLTASAGGSSLATANLSLSFGTATGFNPFGL